MADVGPAEAVPITTASRIPLNAAAIGERRLSVDVSGSIRQAGKFTPSI